MSRGGAIEAGLRALIYVQAGEGADERNFNAIQALRNRAPEGERVTMPQLREMMQRQAALLRADSSGALASIEKMLPEDIERRARLLATVYDVVTADGELTPDQLARFDLVKEAFGLRESHIDALPSPFESRVA
jgi:hypothetical protein